MNFRRIYEQAKSMQTKSLAEIYLETRLNEQLYTTSRAYYIGTKYKEITKELPLSTKYTDIPIIWLTPNKFRAMEFAASDEGIVYRVKLNKYLHIFNARSETDKSKIKEQIPSITENQLENLAYYDFYIWETGNFQGLNKDRKNRDSLIDKIKNIKYGQFDCDGFLNFEKVHDKFSNTNPGLGLFSTKFEIRQAIEFSDYEQEYEWYLDGLNKPTLTEQERKQINKQYYGIY